MRYWCVWWERLHDTAVFDNDYSELRNRVLVNTLLDYETDNFEKDPETKDLHLVAEPGVGRNHGKAMGKSW